MDMECRKVVEQLTLQLVAYGPTRAPVMDTVTWDSSVSVVLLGISLGRTLPPTTSSVTFVRTPAESDVRWMGTKGARLGRSQPVSVSTAWEATDSALSETHGTSNALQSMVTTDKKTSASTLLL